MKRYRISPRGSSGWNLLADTWKNPRRHLSLDDALSCARWLSQINGAHVEITNEAGEPVETHQFPPTAPEAN